MKCLGCGSNPDHACNAIKSRRYIKKKYLTSLLSSQFIQSRQSFFFNKYNASNKQKQKLLRSRPLKRNCYIRPKLSLKHFHSSFQAKLKPRNLFCQCNVEGNSWLPKQNNTIVENQECLKTSYHTILRSYNAKLLNITLSIELFKDWPLVSTEITTVQSKIATNRLKPIA